MPLRRLPIEATTRLRATLAPLSAGWGRIGDDGWWRPFRTPDGPGTIHVRRTAPTAVCGEAWGPGSAWLLDRLPALIGDGDEGGFDPEHPRVRRWHRRRPSRFGRTGMVVEALIHAVLGQRVTRREAMRASRGIDRRYSEKAPGPRSDLWLPPDPVRIAEAPYHAFHGLGIEKHRADTLRAVAARAVRLEGAAGAAPEAAARLLGGLPGVGAWTVAETLVVSHGDVDAVPVGDFHVKHQVAWHLAGEERGTDRRMLELLAEFRPHRGRVVRLVGSREPYPRHGPRRPIHSFGSS